MAIAAKIAVDIVARTESFQKAMSNLSDRLKSTGERISQTGQTLTANFTVPLAAASAGMYQAVQAASDLEETQSAIGVVFGDVAGDIMSFSETAATALGMSQQEALEASRKFGMFAQSAKLSGEETVAFSTEMVQLAADMASFNNASPEQTIYAIGAALRGEAEPIRNFDVLLDDATLRMRAFEMGIIATTKNALTPQQRVLAAHAEILAQTTKQQGDFARTSQGLANQQRILTAEFANVNAQLGQAFLPVALQLVEALRSNVIPLIIQFANYMSSLSPEIIATGVALGGVLAVLGPVLIVIGQVIKVGGMLAGAFSLPVAAIAALSAAFVVLYARSETFRAVVAAMVASLSNFVSYIVGTVLGTISKIIDGLAWLGRAVGSVGAKFGIEFTGDVRNAIDTAKQIISELRAPSLDLGVTGTNAAAQDALYGPIIQASSNVAQGLTVDFDKARDALGSTTIAVKENTLALIPMEQAMRGNIEKMQSQSRVIMAAEDYQRELNEQIENTTLQMGETSMAFDVLSSVMDAFSSANEIAKNRLGGVANSALDMVAKFTPMGIIVEMLSEALEYLMPVVESVIEPFKIIGLVLGKALASILRALFPVIKMVAIAFTYVGQIFFKIAEFLSKAIGYAVYGIGKAIDAIPFVSGKKVIRAGQALIDMGEGFGQAYKDLGNAREEIRGLELPEEKAKESLELTKQSADANKQTAQNTQRIAEALEKERAQPRVQVVIQGGAGRGGTDANADIIRQLDDYFGRSTVYEERAVGRVDSFNE